MTVGFDLAALDDAAATLDGGLRAIEQQLAVLRQYLAPLRAAWTGPAASAFDAHQARWDRSAEGPSAALDQLHLLVRTAHRNYTAAEHANRRMWSC